MIERDPISSRDYNFETEYRDYGSMDYCKWPDLRRKVQPTPELQHAVDERKKVVNKILSEFKQGKRTKETIVYQGKRPNK